MSLDIAKTSIGVKSAPSSRLSSPPIYLDNHATTPIDPRVLEVMMPYLQDNFGNPASTHYYGLKANYAIDKARDQVCRAIQAKPSEIIFTSGATESNNTVIKGVYEHFSNKKPHFIVSNIEHKCILEAVKHIEKLGAKVTILPVNEVGIIEPAQLQKAIKPNTVLVSIMFANNEIGSINDIKSLAAICRAKGVLVHSDAAQAVGKIPIDVNDLNVDFLSASGHKFYAPKGVGFLYVKKSSQKYLKPLLDGGGQEAKLRSGTLNVPAIVGLGEAIELSTSNLNQEINHSLYLRNRLYHALRTAFPDLILNGPELEDHYTPMMQRLAHNLNITLPSVDSIRLGKIYDVAFSSTSACSSGQPTPSYVLMAIGRTKRQANVSLRFGIGRFNTEDDIDQASDILTSTL